MSATATFTSPIWSDDPAVVTVAVEDPAGDIALFTYGTDAEVTRVGVGSYNVTVSVEQGTYTHWWTGTDMVSGGGSVTF